MSASWEHGQRTSGDPSYARRALSELEAAALRTTALAEVGNVLTRISGLPSEIVAGLDQATSYLTATGQAQATGWRPPEAHLGERYWDGRHHLAAVPQNEPGVIILPTGLLGLAQHCLTHWGVPITLWDRRIRPEPGVPDREAVPLRPYQHAAVQALLGAQGQGVLDAPPRSGKTRVGIEVQRCLSLPTLWTAPKGNICVQTVRAFDALFGRNYAVHLEGQAQVESCVDVPVIVCTPDTARDLPQSVYDTRHALFVDEAHHGFARSYRRIAAKTHHIFHRYGMSGTWFRSQPDEELAMRAYLGEAVFRITADELVRDGHLVPTRVVFLPVEGPRCPAFAGKTFQAGVGKYGIFEHEYRTNLAAWAAATLWSRRKRVIVLVGTKAQGYAIKATLEQYFPALGTGYGQVEFVSTDRKKDSQGIIDAFVREDGIGILIGTSMIGEGTDLPSADAQVYAVGGKAEVAHTQAAYRTATASPGKRTAVIVDFADRHNETLLRHTMERLETYCGQTVFQTEVLPAPEHFPAWLDSVG